LLIHKNTATKQEQKSCKNKNSSLQINKTYKENISLHKIICFCDNNIIIHNDHLLVIIPSLSFTTHSKTESIFSHNHKTITPLLTTFAQRKIMFFCKIVQEAAGKLG